ncbi:MAG: glycogen/starch synthase [Bacteroidales bacterium]|nr:glycogen/starch synthase [Bacteroidales bacterium]
MEGTKRVLFINSEIFPYLPESDIAVAGRYLPQGIQEAGKEIRSFMPRYGCINERRNQLHEVIRLSGMNIVVGNVDQPLVIKVSSISAARMQVYFIDNEDYFQRKTVYRDAEGKFFEDNGERAIFFARGVLETVKKLRWKPDIIHCQGWISHFIPMYLKKVYKNDPIFEEAKVVLSLYDEVLDEKLQDDTIDKAMTDNLKKSDATVIKEANGTNLAKLAIQYSDGIILGTENPAQELLDAAKARKLPVLPYYKIGTQETEYIRQYDAFYDKILTSNAKSK